ncbi:hypothetical protein NM688_g3859 [Phlebia brevispora]|uniref:Uncharacterized protein n=1 Tax=Phlebia brevispora TaxID=194682 RepID=A0ACC1T4P1_9APHY|nr:hypothetical protein NM688_g3859 [Phlebia brevispora]
MYELTKLFTSFELPRPRLRFIATAQRSPRGRSESRLCVQRELIRSPTRFHWLRIACAVVRICCRTRLYLAVHGMAGYNITRSIEELLSEHELSPPSFTVHLHPDHWTLNGGSKFLYNNQIASLLDDIRAQRIPTDFIELFEAAKLPFYDGCMIVELLDYRPLKGKEPELANPKRSRVVLSPTPETMWADICLLNHKAGNVWTDEDALQVEAKILLATTPPLCLDPDPHLTRIANSILRVSAPAAPVSLKRKAVAMEPEEDESEKVRRAKIMQYMNPRTNRSTIPRFMFSYWCEFTMTYMLLVIVFWMYWSGSSRGHRLHNPQTMHQHRLCLLLQFQQLSFLLCLLLIH